MKELRIKTTVRRPWLHSGWRDNGDGFVFTPNGIFLVYSDPEADESGVVAVVAGKEYRRVFNRAKTKCGLARAANQLSRDIEGGIL